MSAVKVKEGMEVRDGQPSVAPVYRNLLTKDAFYPTNPDLSTAWELLNGVHISGKPTVKCLKKFYRLVQHCERMVLNLVLVLEFMDPIALSGSWQWRPAVPRTLSVFHSMTPLDRRLM
ncbi:unnamed protein product [Cuscuta europaea]|nr:unnamed protein product [Cuscuta europaea]